MLHDGYVVPSVSSLRHLFNDLSTASYVKYIWCGHDKTAFRFEEANDWRQSMEKMTSVESDYEGEWSPDTVHLEARLRFIDVETMEEATIRFMVIASRDGGDCCFEMPAVQYNEFKGIVCWLKAQIGLTGEADVRIEKGRTEDTAEEILLAQEWYDYETTPDRNNLLVEAAESHAYWTEWKYKRLIEWLKLNGYDYDTRHFEGHEDDVQLGDLAIMFIGDDDNAEKEEED